MLERLAADETRFRGVKSLGVDEHIWHHVNPRTRGPKELTGMVDLTRDAKGRVRARLLDLVPGRSKKAYAGWLADRGEAIGNQALPCLKPLPPTTTALPLTVIIERSTRKSRQTCRRDAG